MITWEPTESDIEWTRDLIEKLRDGGTWAVPAGLSMITGNKKEMKYTLNGNVKNECNQRIMKVMKILGWKLTKESKHE